MESQWLVFLLFLRCAFRQFPRQLHSWPIHPISVCKQTNSPYFSQVWSSLRLVRIIQGRVTLFWGMSESMGYNVFILHWHGEPNDPFADRVSQFTGRVGYLAFQPFHRLLASYCLLWFVLSCLVLRLTLIKRGQETLFWLMSESMSFILCWHGELGGQSFCQCF